MFTLTNQCGGDFITLESWHQLFYLSSLVKLEKYYSNLQRMCTSICRTLQEDFAVQEYMMPELIDKQKV